jgi:hypothetical protein
MFARQLADDDDSLYPLFVAMLLTHELPYYAPLDVVKRASFLQAKAGLTRPDTPSAAVTPALPLPTHLA